MRALNLAAPLLVIAIGAPAWGVTQSIASSFEWVSQSGITMGVGDLARTNISRKQEKISYQIEGIATHLSLSGAMTATQADYSSLLLRAKDGNTIALASLFPRQTELAADVTLDYAHGSHHASVGWLGDLSTAPYPRQMARAAYREGFFNQTTILGARAAYLGQNQPLDFYIDRDFKNQQRPTYIHANELAVSIEQILTTRWKTSLEFSTAIRREERPRNIGVSLQQAYALTDKLFSQLSLTRFSELTSENLKDERGYFSLWSAELSVAIEPVYDLLLSASYALVQERETDPRVDSETQVGSDQYGLGVSYTRGNWKFTFKPGYRISNTRVNGLALSGGFTWQI